MSNLPVGFEVGGSKRSHIIYHSDFSAMTPVSIKVVYFP